MAEQRNKTFESPEQFWFNEWLNMRDRYCYDMGKSCGWLNAISNQTSETENNKENNIMERKDLTWDKIKELAELAASSEKDFYLNMDFDGYIDVEIKTPTRTITRSQMEFIPKGEE